MIIGEIKRFLRDVNSLRVPRSIRDTAYKALKTREEIEKNCQEEYELYNKVASFAPEIIAEKRKMYKGVSPNVDFYSGLVYRMLGLPDEMFTPIFAVSRIVGWSAHRIEEIQNAGKIIRPAYINVKKAEKYLPIEER